jgi:uncharacterized membrane protein
MRFLKHIALNAAIFAAIYAVVCFVAWDFLPVPWIAVRGGLVCLPFFAIVSLIAELAHESRYGSARA